MKNLFIITSLFLLSTVSLFAQNIVLEGYVFEANNRGFLNQVEVNLLRDSKIVKTAQTNTEGFFSFKVDKNVTYKISASKDLFFEKDTILTIKDVSAGEKFFAKIELERKPGYLFDVTLAKVMDGLKARDGLEGAKVEIFNNTTSKEEMTLDSTLSPNFNFTFEQGNHYTILIRKQGFFNKRIEAFVNIKGCILCIDGIDDVKPGVSDNLTQGHQRGTLLANIELQPLELNKTMQIENIYYDSGKFDIRDDAAKELDKLAVVLKENPSLIVELGSHTDARGDDASNQELSQNRANAAVEYIVKTGILKERITAKGYGETKILNRCKNGVTCTDVEHQKNRRTELRIVGFGADPYDGKTLKDIIREENYKKNFDKNVSQLEQEEVIELKEGETLEQKLEGKSAQKAAQEVAKTNKRVKVIGEGSKLVADFSYDEFPVETVFSYVTKTLDGKETISKSSVYNIPKGYTGYLVEIFFSKEKLTDDNAVFTQYENIVTDKTNVGYRVMLGNFAKKEDAELFLTEAVEIKYPDAKVIQYNKGLKVGYLETTRRTAPKASKDKKN